MYFWVVWPPYRLWAPRRQCQQSGNREVPVQVGLDRGGQHQPLQQRQEPFRDMPKITVGEARVRKRLQSLRPDKAAGPDSIPAFMLKTAADELTPMLMRIFQISLNLGQVPSDWKEANIVPMVNKRHCHQPASYRPVSLKPVLNWANVCSQNILRTGPRTMIRFLIELFSSPNMVRSLLRS